MSFLTPKAETPAADNTQGRNTAVTPRQTIPIVLGRGRVEFQPCAVVLNWHFRTTASSQQAFFSILGNVCMGPVDEIVELIVNDKPYNGVFRMRSDTPGESFTHVIPNETVERYTFFWGYDDEATDPTSIIQDVIRDAGHPLKGKSFPKRRAVLKLLIQDMPAGPTSEGQTPPLPKIEVVVNRISPSAFSFGYAAHGTHPIGIVKDILMMRRGGLKQPASYFDDDHWNAQMTRFVTQGIAGKTGTDLFISVVLSDPKETDSQLADILAHFGGWLREKNGKWEIDWASNDDSSMDETGLTVITDHHVAEEDVDEEPASLDGLSSLVIVTGLDWGAEDPLSEASEEVPIPLAEKILGESRAPATYNRSGFTMRSQLKSYGQMVGAMLMNPQPSYAAKLLRQYAVHPDGSVFRAGDKFVLNLTKYGGTRNIVRITERTSIDDVRVQLKVELERGAFPRPAEPALDPRVPLAIDPPIAVSASLAVEAPADLQLTDDPYVIVFAVRPVVSIGSFKINFSANDVWPGQVIGLGYGWSVAAILKTALAPGTADAVLDVEAAGDDWAQMRSESASEQEDDTLLAYHAGEWFSVGTITPTGGGRYNLGVKRVRRGSAPAAHAVNNVFFIIARSMLPMVTHRNFRSVGNPYNTSDATKYFKIQSYSRNLDGPMPGSSISIIMRSRAPAAPSNLFAAAQLGGIYVTWTKSTDSDVITEVFVRSAATPVPVDGDTPDYEEGGSSRLIPGLVTGDHRWIWIRERNSSNLRSTLLGPVDAVAFGFSGPDDGLTPGGITGVAVTAGLGSIFADWVLPTNTKMARTDIYVSATTTRPSLPTYSVPSPLAFYPFEGLSPSSTIYIWLEGIAANSRHTAITGPYNGTTSAGVGLADVAPGLTMVGVVTSLPALPGAYKYVLLTTNLKLYRWDATAGAWTNKVDGADLILDSVTAGAIAAGAVTAYAVGTNLLITNSANIGTAVITGAHIANAEIGTAHIIDLTVGTIKIANDAVNQIVSAYNQAYEVANTSGLVETLSVTIVATGGKILLFGNIYITSFNIICSIERDDGTLIAFNRGTIAGIDQPSAGTYTYILKMYNAGGGSGGGSYRMLTAQEVKK